MIKEGHKHLFVLDEAVLKNIDACKLSLELPPQAVSIVCCCRRQFLVVASLFFLPFHSFIATFSFLNPFLVTLHNNCKVCFPFIVDSLCRCLIHFDALASHTLFSIGVEFVQINLLF